MVVLESMDADTESRRLSPVAIISDTAPQTYVDLVNGPMDHGWCAGYTCQKRLSIFPVVIATGKYPDSKVHGANMGPIWGRQDPGGPYVGPVKFAIWFYGDLRDRCRI